MGKIKLIIPPVNGHFLPINRPETYEPPKTNAIRIISRGNGAPAKANMVTIRKTPYTAKIKARIQAVFRRFTGFIVMAIIF